MESVGKAWEKVRRISRALGPYLMVEIFLPGGTLVALLLFLYRRSRSNGTTAAWTSVAWVQRIVDPLGQLVMPQPCLQPARVTRPHEAGVRVRRVG